VRLFRSARHRERCVRVLVGRSCCAGSGALQCLAGAGNGGCAGGGFRDSMKPPRRPGGQRDTSTAAEHRPAGDIDFRAQHAQRLIAQAALPRLRSAYDMRVVSSGRHAVASRNSAPVVTGYDSPRSRRAMTGEQQNGVRWHRLAGERRDAQQSLQRAVCPRTVRPASPPHTATTPASGGRAGPLRAGSGRDDARSPHRLHEAIAELRQGRRCGSGATSARLLRLSRQCAVGRRSAPHWTQLRLEINPLSPCIARAAATHSE
jgi:hypothetical protein